MSAPFSGTKTRVVGFLKGLFGKDQPAQPESAQDDVVYDYNQITPVTGAQLKSPTPVMPIARSTVNARPPAAAPVAQKNGTGHGVTGLTVATSPVAHKSGHGNGQSGNGHSNGNGHHAGNGHTTGSANGEKAAPKPASTTLETTTIPFNSNPGHGNGAHAPVVPAAKPTPVPAPEKFIKLPLAVLVAALPAELQARVIKGNFGSHTVAVSLETVMAQLPTGVVKISFGALRECAVQFFAPADDADQTVVTLPLGEVLRQISPAQLAKPASQVKLTASDDVTSPFADKGNNARLEVKSSGATRTITPEAQTPATPRQNLGEVPKPAAPTANVPPAVRINLPQSPATPPKSPKPPAPPAATATPAPIPMPRAQAPAPSPSPVAAPTPLAPTPKINGAPALRLAAAPSEPQSSPVVGEAPAPVAKPPTSQASLTVALKSLVDAWPDAVKKEILDENLLNGSVDLPLEQVAIQLKSGRVAFKWDLIRSWMSPRTGVETSHGSVELELPLRVVAPLFLGLKSQGGTKVQRLTADEQIPNVFAAAARPTVAPDAPPAPVVQPTPLPAPAPEAAPVAMTPDAIVNRAAVLKGVAGVLIALPDGLVVASRLPVGQKADSLAAFLPQIYAKFDACLKDLNMEGLNNLSFTAGNVPWRVFRTSSVFFAVFGRANEPLPGDWLGALAGELEKK